MIKNALLICGHGSRSEKHGTEFSALISRLHTLLPDVLIAQGFLETNQPPLGKALQDLIDKGITHITLLPAFLFRGGHVKRDIPAIVQDFQNQNPKINIDYGPALGEDDSFHKVAESCLSGTGNNNSLLLTVGRGSSSGTGQVATENLTRHLVETLNFAEGMTCYAGISQPLLDQALEEIIRKAPARVLVWPCLLFSGMLIDRIETQVNATAQNHPAIEFIFAPPLGSQPLLAEIMAQQARKRMG